MPFTPKPPPTSGATTRMRCSGRPSTSARPWRARCGTCVPDQSVSLPSAALQSATPPRPSIGAAVWRLVRNVRSTTTTAPSMARSTRPCSKRRESRTLPGAVSWTSGAPSRTAASGRTGRATGGPPPAGPAGGRTKTKHPARCSEHRVAAVSADGEALHSERADDTVGQLKIHASAILSAAMSYDLFFRSRTPAPPVETSAVRLTTPRARPILPALDGDMSSGAHEAVAGRERIVPVGGAQVRPRNRLSLTVRGEGRLAYALLAPTLLVILFLVAYPFCAAIRSEEHTSELQ